LKPTNSRRVSARSNLSNPKATAFVPSTSSSETVREQMIRITVPVNDDYTELKSKQSRGTPDVRKLRPRNPNQVLALNSEEAEKERRALHDSDRSGKKPHRRMSRSEESIAANTDVDDTVCAIMNQGTYLAQRSRRAGACLICLDPVYGDYVLSGYRVVFAHGALQFFVRVGCLSKTLPLTALQYRGGLRHDAPGRGQKVRDLLHQAERRFQFGPTILKLEDVPPFSFLRSGVFMHFIVRSCAANGGLLGRNQWSTLEKYANNLLFHQE